MKYPCPCCGFKVLDEPPGSYDICPICYWEDDAFQTDDPFCVGGANTISLYQAQRNYLEFGACKKELLKYVRKPYDSEKKNEKWEKIELPFERTEKVIIDVSNVESVEELHTILKESFDFPDFYGMNWDAFWDAITGLVSMPKVVVFRGWYEFEIKFFKESRMLKSTFEDFENEYPELCSKVTYYEYS